MKILIGIKRVVDFAVRVQVKKDGTGVVADGVKMGINPFDEIALARRPGKAQALISR